MKLVVEGPDLSGKDTYLEALVAHLRKNDFRVFDVVDFWKKSIANLQRGASYQGKDPEVSDLDMVPDVIVYSEPSYVLDGHRIRSDLLRSDRREGVASIDEVANAFAQDRYRIAHMLDALAQEFPYALLVSGRNFLSSMLYQPLQYELREKNGLAKGAVVNEEYIRSIKGNAFCLQPEYVPDHVVLCLAPGDELIRRRNLRSEKRDYAETETNDFLQAIAPRYRERAPKILDQLGISYTVEEIVGTVEDTISLGQKRAELLIPLLRSQKN